MSVNIDIYALCHPLSMRLDHMAPAGSPHTRVRNWYRLVFRGDPIRDDVGHLVWILEELLGDDVLEPRD